MPRIALSAIALILIWLAPVAAAPPTTWTATPPIQPSMKTIPPPALETLRRSLKESAGLLPAPDKPYVLLAEETKIEVDPGAPWHPRLKVWVRPAHATAVRTYDVPADAPGIPEELRRLLGPIEVTVELNGDTRFAELASEGGAPSLIPIRDATAVRVAAIAPDAIQGRMATMTPRQAKYRLAALTIFVGDPAAEANIRSAVKLRASPKPATAHTTDPSELQLIAVRIRGPLEPAEELAHHIPAGALRLLLRH